MMYEVLDKIASLLVVGGYVFGAFYYWWYVKCPSAELSEILANGFPNDEDPFSDVQVLAEQLKSFEDKEYITYAFAFAYIARHNFKFGSGLFHMNLIAGFLFGFFEGTIFTTVLTTFGCMVSFFISRFLVNEFIPLFANTMDRILPKDKVCRDKQQLTENQSNKSNSVDANGNTANQQPMGWNQTHQQAQRTNVRGGSQVAPHNPNRLLSFLNMPERRSSLAMLLFFRLVPIVPSWFLNYVLGAVGSTTPEFVLSVALGYLPFNMYTMAISKNLLEVAEAEELQKKALLATVVMIVGPIYYFIIRQDPISTLIRNAIH